MTQPGLFDQPLPPIKALTLHQPWASLMAWGFKRWETRSWATGYRGPLAIHAAKTIPAYAQEAALELPFFEVFEKTGASLATLPLGRVLAVCRLVNCRQISSHQVPKDLEGDIGREEPFGDFSIGRYAWITEDVRIFEPIPARGAQGLWSWAPPIELREELGL